MKLTNIFVYGTLRDKDVLSAVLGPDAPARQPVSATAADLRVVRAGDGPYPGLKAASDLTARGTLVRDLSTAAVERLTYFEGAFAFNLENIEVVTEDGAVPAKVFWPVDSAKLPDDEWSFEEWEEDAKPLFLEMARDIMSVYPEGGAKGDNFLRGGALRRAVAKRQAVGRAVPSRLRSGFAASSIQDFARDRNHVGFFSSETVSFRFPTFDGGLSETVEREVFVTGDAVSVLPWDPARDLVLLIEQVRAGAITRGDLNPWGLEAIAGLLDKDESPEAAARREAEEEAGLILGHMEEIASYYSSPGALTEHMTSFIAEADLGQAGGVHGLASEAENIRSFVVPFEEAMETVESGEAGNAPLLISLMALATRRERLRAAWG